MAVSLDEYFKMRENSEDLLEYIDGFVFMAPSPSTRHQRVASRLQVKWGQFLEGKECEVFCAPYDIELKNEKMEGTKIVIPDISIICNKDGFTDARYVGIPDLIIEILSPSNQSHELVTKLNLYMNYGVPEYWIINPMLHSITVYALNHEALYEQHDMKTENGQITSKLFDEFRVELEYLFQS
ncbi:Uma2 family endonuclease [Ammoniphilus sp. CFH 90114]|uniref:Uma2 family endonuclease n=1 Tax=Ammoniphilus sp. CFH 90114 TaxID=2493665 RepID=UPI00100E56EF|nr:Uma2 family endonuclease [Ammoniphilus sp. CFH 90114]RXT06959.1 Uma2 family endonuclease [Ammoniphilus sp. CFH 90114]